MDHNNAPYIIKNPEYFPENYRLVYNPETRAFGLPSGGQGHYRTHRMDVLSAELFCSTTNCRWDIAEHLTQVSWKAQYAPSIYEMILCWMLHQKAPPFSHSTLSKMKLRIETAEINPTTFTLDNDEIRRRYIGF